MQAKEDEPTPRPGRHPAFGANMFSGITHNSFEPLPYPHAGRIAAISETYSNGSRTAGTFGPTNEWDVSF